MALQDYLDVMALGLNDQQHGDASKLGSADPHMLASYCFDLTRKQHYLYMALRLSDNDTRPESERVSFEYNHQVISTPEALARAIYLDTQFVEDAAEQVRQAKGALWNRARDWEARAYALEEIIIRQWKAIRANHERLFAEFRLDVPTYLGAPGRTPAREPTSAVWPDVHESR